MAYDVTSLTTAVAQGIVDENVAKQLIADFTDWEIRVAKALAQPAPVVLEQAQVAEQPQQ